MCRKLQGKLSYIFFLFEKCLSIFNNEKYFILFLAVFAFLYHDYLVGTNYYILSLVPVAPNHDYLLNYWPHKYFLNHMPIISKDGIQWFVFQFGIGNSIIAAKAFILDPFRFFSSFIPMELPQLEIYIFLIKMSIIFFVAQQILILKNMPRPIVGLGALVFTFCGMFVYWSTQDVNFTALVFIVVQWYGYEKFRRADEVKYFVVFALPLFMLNTVYYVTMSNIFLILFFVLDILPDEELSKQEKISALRKLSIGYAIIILLSAWSILPEIWVLTNSVRVDGHINIMDLFTWKHYSQFVLRGFANYAIPFDKILGSPHSGPLWYSSLIIPVSTLAFVIKNWRYSFKVRFNCVFVVVSFIFLPLYIGLFNGFSDVKFRFSWLLLMPMLLCAAEYWKIESLRRNRDYKQFRYALLAIGFVFLLALFYECKIGDVYFASWQVRITYIVLGILSVVYFMATYFPKNIYWIMTAAIILEIVFNSWMFLANAAPIDKDYTIKHEYYYDGTVDAVSSIKESDKENFYRIDKNYASITLANINFAGLNENLIQGYEGVKQYSSVANAEYFKFSKSMEAKPFYNFIYGFDGRYDVLKMLGVKYILSKNEMVMQGYDFIRKVDDIYIYQNKNFSGIGKIFHKGVSSLQFAQLGTDDKDKVFSRAIICKDGAENIALENINVVECLAQPSVLDNETEKFQLTEVNGNHAMGSVSLISKGVLFLAIPYDKGFSAYVDGVKSDVLNVSGGFLGLELTEGKHNIRLEYFPPLLKEGIIISITTMLGLALFFLYKLKKDKKL